MKLNISKLSLYKQNINYVLRIVLLGTFNPTMDVEDSFTIPPPSIFDENIPFIFIENPFCEKNENKSNNFINKFHHFTNGKYRISINWITKKVNSLFQLKKFFFQPATFMIHNGIILANAFKYARTK